MLGFFCLYKALLIFAVIITNKTAVVIKQKILREKTCLEWSENKKRWERKRITMLRKKIQ